MGKLFFLVQMASVCFLVGVGVGTFAGWELHTRIGSTVELIQSVETLNTFLD